MLPLGNRPVIDYVVQECVLAGITDIYLVVNNISTSQIKAYYESAPKLEQYLRERRKTHQTQDSAKQRNLPLHRTRRQHSLRH